MSGQWPDSEKFWRGKRVMVTGGAGFLGSARAGATASVIEQAAMISSAAAAGRGLLTGCGHVPVPSSAPRGGPTRPVTEDL